MTLLRQDTDYAMRILVVMAQRKDQTRTASELARISNVPLPYSHKILKRMQKAGLLVCKRGATGGFRLAMEPKEITLAQVIEAIQGPVAVSRCLLGEGICPRQGECRISAKLSELQAELLRLLRETTLLDVLGEFEKDSCNQLKGDK
ncbi:MAG TPA: Rrf2 family transcriptional regulator [Candidatus Brocadiia bacterium]|nr:Rrf2 family transcriptional regulator [Candidatus Brocadiia bacterium]